MTTTMKPGQSGRARFRDIMDRPADAHPLAGGAGSAGLGPNEIVVAHFPAGTYRIVQDLTGVRLVRCDLSNTADAAGPPTPATINARNEKFWKGRK